MGVGRRREARLPSIARALLDARSCPEERTPPVSQLAGEPDGCRRQRGELDWHALLGEHAQPQVGAPDAGLGCDPRSGALAPPSTSRAIERVAAPTARRGSPRSAEGFRRRSRAEPTPGAPLKARRAQSDGRRRPSPRGNHRGAEPDPRCPKRYLRQHDHRIVRPPLGDLHAIESEVSAWVASRTMTSIRLSNGVKPRRLAWSRPAFVNCATHHQRTDYGRHPAP